MMPRRADRPGQTANGEAESADAQGRIAAPPRRALR